jgi:hypothetical protein
MFNVRNWFSLKQTLATVLSLLVAFGVWLEAPPAVTAATLSGGSVSLSDSRPSQSANYTIDFDNVTTSNIRCIKVVFSDAASGGSAPTGLSVTGVTVNASSDYVASLNSWTVATSSGTVQVTDATGAAPAQAADRTVILDGITNGSTGDTAYFVQFSTYNNTDCSTDSVDSGKAAFIYTAGVSVSTTVDPSITFTVNASDSATTFKDVTTDVTTTSTTVPLGTITSSASRSAAHRIRVNTNASSGYTVYIRSTQDMTAGAATISNVSGSNASPATFTAAGTEGWGYTTNDSTLGTGTADRFSANNTWAAFTSTNAEVAYSSTGVSNEDTLIGYRATIAGNTEAGTYETTVIFTATPAY